MKYYTTENSKLLKSKIGELTALEKIILERCRVGLNVVRVIKSGKPYYTHNGERRFATTGEVLKSVTKLQDLELLERR